MDSENLKLQIINESIENFSTQDEGFVIDNDAKAEWVLGKIAEEKAESQRYINVCQSMINEYQEKIRKAEEKLNNKLAFFEGQLHKYFQSVPHKSTQTQETYKLPSGTLKFKYLLPEFKRDDGLLLKWLKENSLSNFIKIEEKPNWVEFKKQVKVSGEIVVTDDGQIVDGIQVIERAPVFMVET